MQEDRLDSFLCSKRENILYLCGFTGSAGVLIVSSDSALLLTDGRYEIQAAQEVRGAQVEVVRDELLPTACQRISPKAGATVGFEGDSVSYQGYRTLLEQLPEEAIRPTSKLVEQLRMVKDEEEIAALRAACQCIEAALRSALSVVEQGITEKDLAAEIDYRLAKLDARKPAFDTIVAFGDHAALPHAVPQGRPLSRGDGVLVDCGALLGDYCSDVTRTFFLSEPPKDAVRVYEAVLSAQAAALEALQAGRKASEVDDVARKFLETAGFGKAFGHALGHGVGLEVHESPRLSWKDNTCLEDGMIVTVEPGVYLEGLLGVRIEDMACVAKGRPKLLTSFPKALEEAVL
jgi:Xaa-Pro aminopeptidase